MMKQSLAGLTSVCAARTLTNRAEPGVLADQRPAAEAERRGQDTAARREQPGGLSEPAPLSRPAVPGRRPAEGTPPGTGCLAGLQAHVVLARAGHVVPDDPPLRKA